MARKKTDVHEPAIKVGRCRRGSLENLPNMPLDIVVEVAYLFCQRHCIYSTFHIMISSRQCLTCNLQIFFILREPPKTFVHSSWRVLLNLCGEERATTSRASLRVRTISASLHTQISRLTRIVTYVLITIILPDAH